jgi:hypothetical protein
VIPRRVLDNIKKIKNKRTCRISSSDSLTPESIEEISRRKNSYIDSTFLEGPSMVKLIKKTNYFDYTTGQVRKDINEGKRDIKN